jgi:membrane dipeptidase
MLFPIFDGHNDILLRLFKRGGADAAQSFLAGEGKGQLDLPMARAGGFAGGLFAIFVPSSSGGSASQTDAPSVDLAGAQKVTIAMASLLLRIERQSQGAVRMCRSADDIEAARKAGALAAVLHLEGCEPIDEDFAFLDMLYAVGLRSLGPVWSRSNVFGHGVPFRFPSSPDIGPGLTDLGKALVRYCDERRILVDLSHLNERGFWDVAEISKAPLVATHSNAHAVCQHSRNLTDAQLDAIRKTGGLAGVNFGVSFLRADGQANADTPLEQVVAHIDYLLEHLGEDGVGLGSDFDGARIPAAIGNAAGLPRLVEAMQAKGYSDALVEKVCFKNWLGVLRRTWDR